MVDIKNAKIVTENYKDLNGKTRRFYAPFFNEDEIKRAATIVKALKGLRIASARELFEKINQYLLMEEIR